jgi:ribosomal protein L25 (general stress protein Ctc)
MSTASATPLQVTERDNTLNPRQLRSAGFIPATVYGKSIDAQSIQTRTKDFTKLYANGARDFKLEGLTGNLVAKVQDVQMNPITQEILSIQFLVAAA